MTGKLPETMPCHGCGLVITIGATACSCDPPNHCLGNDPRDEPCKKCFRQVYFSPVWVPYCWWCYKAPIGKPIPRRHDPSPNDNPGDHDIIRAYEDGR